jgi:hypothetical protein
MHMLDYESSDDESKEVYVAEFTWSSDDKTNTCASLKPTHKSRQEEFSFDVAKCDRIFDELLKLGKIKISHTLPPPDEIKKHAYCKFIIFIPMLLMIVIVFVGKYNRPLMKAI